MFVGLFLLPVLLLFTVTLLIDAYRSRSKRMLLLILVLWVVYIVAMVLSSRQGGFSFSPRLGK